MPEWVRPTTYKGPYGKMNSKCPTTRKAIDIGVAADAGYCGKVGNDIDSVEADIVQMINLANTIYSDQANIFLRLRTIKVNRSVWLCR